MLMLNLAVAIPFASACIKKGDVGGAMIEGRGHKEIPQD